MTNAELKAAIVAAVYENTNGAITGDVLQDILLKIVEQFEVPTFNVEALSGTDETGTLAECAAAAGVSENMFLRLCHGEVPVVNLGVFDQSGNAIYYWASLGSYKNTGGPCVYRTWYSGSDDNVKLSQSSGVEFYDNGGGSFTFKCLGD